jgi:2-dehydro-3-deoxyphosphogluconate aldolase/(4S)-4-hydroxy-2-oxoglutarate aldolase
MEFAMPRQIQDEIAKGGIIAVLEIESEQNAVPVVKALAEGGITVIELTLRTSAAIASIMRISEEVPQCYIGIGTIIESGQAAAVKQHTGVRFGVSPGINPVIVKEALNAQLPFAPGVATPSEIELALSLGCRVVKFFPAEQLGGLPYLKNINAPYKHLDIKYIPLGGISQENLAPYVESDNVLAVGGSWIANKDIIREQNWSEITKRARMAKKTWDSIRVR